jgi:hypothetical protein
MERDRSVSRSFGCVCKVTGSVMDPHHFDADPDSAYHLDADPDLTFQPVADPDPSFQIKAQTLQSVKIGSNSIHFGLSSAN